jgi:hypothetical protein
MNGKRKMEMKGNKIRRGYLGYLAIRKNESKDTKIEEWQ